MAEGVLFHHIQGRTDGVLALAAELEAGGHEVHTPDLFDVERPPSIEAGAALVESIGSDALDQRAGAMVAGLRAPLVYAGISLGAAIAQRLGQTRSNAAGVLLYEGCLPVSGDWAVGPWPVGLPVQIHGMDDDPFFAHEGDIESTRKFVATAGQELAELFVYPGSSHLFTDSSLPSYDAGAAGLAIQRSKAFLERLPYQAALYM